MSRAVPRFRRNNPALVPPNTNLFEVILQGSVEGQMTINTFYYWDNGAGLIPGSESNLTGVFNANVFPLIQACLSIDWAAISVKVRCITDQTRSPFVSNYGVGTNGTGPAGHEPTSVAALISRYTNFRGQAGRGRLYLPAVPSGWVANSSILTANFGPFTTLASALSTTWISGGTSWTPQIFSKGTRFQPRAGAANIARGVARQLLATIRRRRVGRGK